MTDVIGGEKDEGYGKPPKRWQFKPGKSGNPKGRPKGSKNLATIFDEESKKVVAVREGGKVRKVAKRELAVAQITNKAAAGDLRAALAYFNLYLRLNGVAPIATSQELTAEERELAAWLKSRQAKRTPPKS